MTELQSAYKAARQKTQLRGPIFSLGQTAPTFGIALCFYYGGYLISTEGLHYTNVIKFVYFAININSKTKFLFLTNEKFSSTLRSLSPYRFTDYVFLLYNY
jgi:hypothetical protein